MKFRFCGEVDCPDWVLAEINTLSRLSSVKIKLLAQVVVQGIINPPINIEKAEKLVADSKLDCNVDLKACIACLTYIITSAVRFNCDQNALHSELQQLGLPREHSTSIKRVTVDNNNELTAKLQATSLKVNALQTITVKANSDYKCASLDLQINGEDKNILLTSYTIDVLLENLKKVKTTMEELNNSSYVFT